jgi:hypothetical protein
MTLYLRIVIWIRIILFGDKVSALLECMSLCRAQIKKALIVLVEIMKVLFRDLKVLASWSRKSRLWITHLRCLDP